MTKGYGGTTVLACRLQELNAISLTLNRRKREINEPGSDDQVLGNSNSTDQDTNSTTTTTPKPTTTITTKSVSRIVYFAIYYNFISIIQENKYEKKTNIFIIDGNYGGDESQCYW